MKLAQAAKFFDRDSVYDGYTGAYLFKAQFASYDSSQPDGSFERRRTISVAPSVTPPPRNAVTVHDERWLVGEFITDGFFDRTIRKTASAKSVTDLFDLVTPGQAALNLPAAVQAYGQARYLKDTVNTSTTSDYSPQYEVSFGMSETIPDEHFIRSATNLYHVRTLYTALEGFHVATCDLIGNTQEGDNKFVTVVFSGLMDPITELPAPGVTTTGILMFAYKLYYMATEGDPNNRPGDKTLIVAQSAVTPISGTTISIDGAPYRIFSAQLYYDSWNLKVRKA
jgi:hypothetical protein